MGSRPSFGLAGRQAAGPAGLAVLVAVVVLGVFAYVSRLMPAEEPRPADATATAGLGAIASHPPVTPNASPPGRARPTRSPTSAVPSGPLPPSSSSGGPMVTYRDEASGFTFDLPASWRPLGAEGPAGAGPSDEEAEPRTAVFVEETTGARLALTVWGGGGAASLTRQWVSVTAPGMSSVDGRWPTEAIVAGSPAVIVWSDEAPDAPARYAAFVRHGGDLVRISYAAGDGGRLLGEYARALVSLEWDGAETTDLIPPLPRPSGRYFPPSTGSASTP